MQQTTTTMHHVADSLNKVRTDLNAYFLEREDAIDAALLALLAGEHAFILGPPGTAKSELIRALVKSLMGARYFEALLSKTRPAEAVNGPLDIKEFRENGNYFLKRAGYATQVELLFLDEIGKMSPVLGHDLLALLNERVYHEVNGGRSVHQAPLSTAFTASNEMLTSESDDAAALWDRLMVRVTVDYLKDKANFARLLDATDGYQANVEIPWDELKRVIEHEVPAIPLSDDARTTLVKLRFGTFANAHIYPSDRRWKKSIRILQASAFLNGRSEVEEDDLAALRFTLWDTVEQIETVHRLCLSASNPFVEPLMEIRDSVAEVKAGLETRAKEAEDDPADAAKESALVAYGRDGIQKLQKVKDRLTTLQLEAQGREIPGFKTVADGVVDLGASIYERCMQQDPETAGLAALRRLGI